MPTEKKKYVFVFIIICVFLVAFFFFNKGSDGIIVSNDEYRFEIKAEVQTVNRFELTGGEGGVGLIMPHSASNSYFTQIYNTGFEDNNHNWSSSQYGGYINTNIHKTFSGYRSYMVRRGISYLNQQFILQENETIDMSYFIFAEYEINNGFCVFSFNASSGGTMKQFDFIIQNGQANGYIAPSSDHIVTHLDSFITRTWLGYVIEDVRGVVSSHFTTIDEIIVSNIKFNIDRPGSFSDPWWQWIHYFDEFTIQKYPYGGQSGLWYNINQPATDYNLVLSYSAFVDTNVVDLSSVNIQIDFRQNIQTPSQYLSDLLVDLLIYDNFLWTDYTHNQYNKKSTGTISSRNYPIPRSNIGNTLVYSFYCNITIGGYTYSMEPQFDEIDYQINGFTLKWVSALSF